MPTITGPQIFTQSIDAYTGQLSAPSVSEWDKRLKALKKHPTIKLARLLSVAPAIIRKWTTEATMDNVQDEVHDHIRKTIIPHQADIVADAMLGLIDWGWVAFERVIDEEQKFAKLKKLLHILTTLLADPENGDLVGVRQEANNYKDEVVELFIPDCVIFTQNVEGQEWYGASDCADAEAAYLAWTNANEVARRYDEKTAGAHWVIKYPMGVSDYNGEKDVDNGIIAQDILNALKSNGLIAIPQAAKRFLDGDGTSEPAWNIELMESSANTSVSLETRLRYCDVLMVRAFAMPERALTEGQHGTKAEAEAHGDAALTYIDMRLQHIMRGVNEHIVKPELITHFGEAMADAVRIIPEPMDAERRAYLQSVYDKILSTPEGFMAELDDIDVAALRDVSQIPSKEMN